MHDEPRHAAGAVCHQPRVRNCLPLCLSACLSHSDCPVRASVRTLAPSACGPAGVSTGFNSQHRGAVLRPRRNVGRACWACGGSARPHSSVGACTSTHACPARRETGELGIANRGVAFAGGLVCGTLGTISTIFTIGRLPKCCNRVHVVRLALCSSACARSNATATANANANAIFYVCCVGLAAPQVHPAVAGRGAVPPRTHCKADAPAGNGAAMRECRAAARVKV